MPRRLLAILLVALFPVNCFALSDKDFDAMYKSSEEFKEADQALNKTWKRVYSGLKEEDKKFLLNMHKEWIKSGRDDQAREYMNIGFNRECAYAKATRKWVKSLDLYEHNAHLTPQQQEAGAAKADDAFWDEDDYDIPERCRKK